MAGTIRVVGRSETGSKFDLELSLGQRTVRARIQVQDILDLQLTDDDLLTLARIKIRQLMKANSTRDIAVIKQQLEATDLTS